MAKLTTGILGDVTGKVGNVVGGLFKGINYVRAYFVPANPQSGAQTTNRNKLKEIVRLSKPILASIIREYYRAIITGRPTTEWAEHMKYNMLAMANATAYADYGFKDNANYWYSNPESADLAGVVTLTWDVEDSSKEDAVTHVVLTQPDLQIPSVVLSAGDVMGDASFAIQVTDYTTSKDLYASLMFKYTDPVSGEITWSTAHNFGRVHDAI